MFIFEAIGILGSEFTHTSSLFPKEDEDKASKEGFLKAEEVEILLEECFVMWWVWGFSLEWTHLLALELVLERRLRESRNLQTCCELS